MDPVSIVGIVTSATTLTKLLGASIVHLAIFIKDAKVVNETVQRLHLETVGLEHALRSMRKLIQPDSELANSLQALQCQEHLVLLKDSVSSCETIANILSTKVSELQPSKKRTNPFAKTKLQIKIDLSQQEVRQLRDQAHGHKLNIQMAMELLNLTSSLRSPAATYSLLQPQLSELTGMVFEIRRYMVLLASSNDPISAATENALQGSRQLVRSAQQAFSSAGSTVGGSTIGDDIASVIFDLPQTSGSDHARSSSIQDWVTNSSSQTMDSSTDVAQSPRSLLSAPDLIPLERMNSAALSLEENLNSLRDKGYITSGMIDKILSESRFISKSKSVRSTMSDALCSACLNGDLATVDILLKSGAPPNARSTDCNNATALIQAVKGDNPSIVEALLDHGSEIEDVVIGDLHQYMKDTFEGTLKSRQFPQDAEYTALSYAAALGKDACVASLLARKPDLNHAEHKTGMPPIHLASYAGHASIVRMLLQAGAETIRFLHADEKQDFGSSGGRLARDTAHIAAQEGHCEVLKVLKDHSEQRLTTSKVPDPQYFASRCPSFHLGSRGIPQDRCDFIFYGRSKWFQGSLLHALATAMDPCEGLQDVLELLISWGLDVNNRSEMNRTPLDVAVCCETPSTVQLLLRYGSNANIADHQGYTAMHLLMLLDIDSDARMASALQSLQILLDDDADPGRLNHAGRSPLQARGAEIPHWSTADRDFVHIVKARPARKDLWSRIEWNSSFTEAASQLIEAHVQSAQA